MLDSTSKLHAMLGHRHKGFIAATIPASLIMIGYFLYKTFSEAAPLSNSMEVHLGILSLDIFLCYTNPIHTTIGL